MKTAKEFWISKFPDAEKDWQKTGHDDNFQVRMMEEYAKYYHEQQVKSIYLADVVNRSEQLPSDDEIEKVAEENANKFYAVDTEWYAWYHGFIDGVEWFKNYLAEQSNIGSVGKSLLEEYPTFEKAYSVRKLHKDLENPVCKCNGGYCYARNEKGDIVRPCEL